MNKQTVFKKLGRFGSSQKTANQTYFYSRSEIGKTNQVLVVDQGSSVVCLPIYVDEKGREEVAFHAKTVKSLVEFLEGK